MHKIICLLYVLFGLAWTENMPPKSTFYLTENYKKCILVTLMADVQVGYECQDGTMKQATFNVTSTSELQISGNCGENEKDTFAQIVIDMPEKQQLMLNFSQESSHIYLQGMEFHYTLSNQTFKTPKKSGPRTAVKSGADLPLSQYGHFYQCEMKQKFELDPNVTVTFYWAKIQAFNVVNDTFSRVGENCTMGVTTLAPATTEGVATTEATVEPASSEFSTMETTETATTEYTTEESNATTETTAAITTTMLPTTSPHSVPKYYVEDNSGNVCLVAQFSAKFDIPYETATKKASKTISLDSSSGKSLGMCSSAEETLVLEWTPHDNGLPWILELVFTRPEKAALQASVGNDYVLSTIALNYTIDKASFPDAKQFSNVSVSSHKSDRYKTTVGTSYTCMSGTSDNLGDGGVVMKTANFKVEAFRTSNSTDFGNKNRDCPVDESKNSTVPIIVGVVLAVLVVIVLIVYIVGRRRQTASNYETL